MESQERSTLRGLIEAGKSFDARGWVLGTSGNFSARGPGGFWITASGQNKGALSPEDFLWIPDRGNPTTDKRSPSAETEVHQRLYAENIGETILHVHAPYLTWASKKHLHKGSISLEGYEMIKGLGLWAENAKLKIPIVPNHGSIPQLAEAIVAQKISSTPGVWVAGHGVYGWGENIGTAQRHIECFEFLAQQLWLACHSS